MSPSQMMQPAVQQQKVAQQQQPQSPQWTAPTQSRFSGHRSTTMSTEPSEIKRLILLGRPASESPTMGATLRDLAGSLGFVYIAEMSEYLAQRGVDPGSYINLLQYHLIGVPDGDVFG